ncbi:MAG: EamA family transporter, partial [Candidatus Marsarchaeota archaeon]|nr:EamA family transporter [Candidatus Marsarchaeota archaeon]
MRERKGYLLIALAASMWGTSGIFVKLLYGHQFDSYSLAFMQAFFAFAITLVFALVAHRSALRISIKNLPFLASYGLVGVAIFPLV